MLALCAALITACSDGGSQAPLDPGADARLSGEIVRDGIEYDAEVAVLESFPVQLSGRVTLRNRVDERRTLTFADGCLALMRAYRAGGGGPVWDQAAETGCTMALVPIDLARGEERVLTTGVVSARDVLGEDLPDGSYRLAVYLRLVDEGVVEVEIPVGTVDLAIPR